MTLTWLQLLALAGLAGLYGFLGRHAVFELVEWRRRITAQRKAQHWAHLQLRN